MYRKVKGIHFSQTVSVEKNEFRNPDHHQTANNDVKSIMLKGDADQVIVMS